MSTDEIAALFADANMVRPSGFKNQDLADMTADQLDKLIYGIERVAGTTDVVVGGVTVGAMAALWPFVMAYLRKNITQEQMTRVFERALGELGVSLASRVSYGLLFGPVFAWYLLARGVLGIVKMAEPEASTTYYVSYQRKD